MKGEHYEIILEALERSQDLTEWEHEFIDSLADKDEVEDLSPNQIEVLIRIGEKL